MPTLADLVSQNEYKNRDMNKDVHANKLKELFYTDNDFYDDSGDKNIFQGHVDTLDDYDSKNKHAVKKQESYRHNESDVLNHLNDHLVKDTDESKVDTSHHFPLAGQHKKLVQTPTEYVDTLEKPNQPTESSRNPLLDQNQQPDAVKSELQNKDQPLEKPT
ncbi:hypothetical protein BDV3_004786 [Batrachochytrium dendrobatidis]|nr:hypothetical protein BDEG_24003 [Batrachochytrium dendrobatidis JEL423]